jgi:hypothetical protein
MGKLDSTCTGAPPVSPVAASPTLRSNFQLFKAFERCMPVDSPLTGPTCHVRWPFECVLSCLEVAVQVEFESNKV